MPSDDVFSVTSHGRLVGSNAGEREGPKRQCSGEGEGRTSPSAVYNPYYTGRPRTPVHASNKDSMDRQEIIRRIKEREGGRHNVSKEGAYQDYGTWRRFHETKFEADWHLNVRMFKDMSNRLPRSRVRGGHAHLHRQTQGNESPRLRRHCCRRRKWRLPTGHRYH